MARRRVVVTGASGFLGRAAVSALARHAALEPVAVSRRVWRGPDGVVMQQVASYEQTELPQGADLVHLAETAAIGSVTEAEIERGRAVFAGLLDRLSGHVVYASSAAIYGDTSNEPHRTDEALPKTGPYALLKQDNERAALDHGGTVLRFANLFGPGMNRGTVIDDVLTQLGRRGPVVLRDRSSVRDFLWIEDAAAAVVAALEKKIGGVFNVGSGEAVSVSDIVHAALRIAGENDRGIEESAPKAQASTIRLDIGDTERRLGWQPRITFEDGLRRLIEARRKTHNA